MIVFCGYSMTVSPKNKCLKCRVLTAVHCALTSGSAGSSRGATRLRLLRGADLVGASKRVRHWRDMKRYEEIRYDQNDQVSFLIISIGIKEQNGTALIGTNFENLKVSDQSRHLRALHDMLLCRRAIATRCRLIAILPPPQPCDEAGKCFVQVQPGRLPHRLALPQGKVRQVSKSSCGASDDSDMCLKSASEIGSKFQAVACDGCLSCWNSLRNEEWTCCSQPIWVDSHGKELQQTAICL